MGKFCFIPPKPQSTTTVTKSSIDVGNNSETDTNKTSKLSSICNPEDINGQILEVPNLRIYTFDELRTATRNFKPVSQIGGGFSMVYKGWVDRNTLNPTKTEQGNVVAVKIVKPDSTKRLEEWQAEVDSLGRLSHPNLGKLLGYCIEESKLLVYEYTAKGSLEDLLFRKAPEPEPLPWNIRLKILIGAAQGLAFLHNSKKQAMYGDFNASNILLDSDYSAKLFDFGIRKYEQPGEDCCDCCEAPQIVQTYAACEYVASGYLYMESDVYGFGVVLLEMLSGLRAFDRSRPKQMQNLVYWAKPYLLDQNVLLDLVMDKSLEGQYNQKAALQAAQLTFHCLAANHRKRPSMEEVANILRKVEAIPLSRWWHSKDGCLKTIKRVI